ncbi:TIGR03086 family metal-binding protein [Blastococcus sp. SYSU D00820]
MSGPTSRTGGGAFVVSAGWARFTGEVPDRDAAELLELLQRAQNAFTDRVDAVEAGQWDDEALPGWTVADLVAHLVHEARRVPRLLAGEPADPASLQGPAPSGRGVGGSGVLLLGGDPLAAWEDAADGALTAVALHGDLDGTVALDGGPVPVRAWLTRLTADLTVHAWDLARATGGDERLDPALLAAAARAAELLPPGGVPGAFGPAVDVPAGAPEQVRVLARFGRRA